MLGNVQEGRTGCPLRKTTTYLRSLFYFSVIPYIVVVFSHKFPVKKPVATFVGQFVIQTYREVLAL